MRTLRTLVVFWLTAGTGCVLPFPHFKQTCGPIEGTVLDVNTQQPVPLACIAAQYPDGGKLEARTDKAGRFSFPSKYRFHWGAVVSPALSYSIPYDMGWHDFTRVYIDHEAYQLAYFSHPDTGYPDRLVRPDKERYQQIHPKAETTAERDPMGSSRHWYFRRIYISSRSSTDCSMTGS